MFGPIDFSPVIYIQIFSRNAVAVYKKKENNVPPNAGEVAKAFDIPLFLFLGQTKPISLKTLIKRKRRVFFFENVFKKVLGVF